MRHKYVRHSQFGVVLFAEGIEVTHTKMARMLNTIPSTGFIISAGFVWVETNGTVKVEGRSESLNMGRLPDDAPAIHKQFGWILTTP